MSTFNQPCVGDEVSHPWEAAYVVDLVEDHQGQGFSHTRDSSKQMNGHRIVFGNLAVDLPLDGEDLLVDGIHQCGIHLHAGTDIRVSETRIYVGTIGSAVNKFLEVREIVLGVGVLDVHLKLRVLTRKVQPAM